MTQQELNALVEILNRCPMTQAERLWLAGLVQRIEKEIAAVPTEADISVEENSQEGKVSK